MLQMAKKNYEKLPENQKKDTDCSRKEDLEKRKQNVKALEEKRLKFIKQQREKKLQRESSLQDFENKTPKSKAA